MCILPHSQPRNATLNGVEAHGGNGYLPEQFLSSSISKRTDEYGVSPGKRCKLVLRFTGGAHEHEDY